MNRILASVDKVTTHLEELIKSGKQTQDQINQMGKSLNITDPAEFASLQDLKSLAMIDGKMTLEEAETVYSYLGNSPGVFNSQPAAVKLVVTQLHKELLDKKMRGEF